MNRKINVTKLALLVCVATALQACVSLDGSTLSKQNTDDNQVVALKQSIPDDWITDTDQTYPNSIRWSDFKDPILDRLIQQGLESNLNVASVLLSLESAIINLQSTKARARPNLSVGSGDARVSRARGEPAQESYRLGAQAAYQIDLWGRVKNSVTLSKLSLNDAQINLKISHISLAQAIAELYFDIRVQDELIRLQEQQIKIQQKDLTLSEVRMKAGSISRLSVDQINVAIQRLRNEDENLKSQRVTLERSLSILLGKPSQEFKLSSRPFEFTPIPRLNPSSPAELIFARPDLVLAEQAIQSTNISLDTARKAWLPSLSINASSSSNSMALSDLLSTDLITRGISAGFSVLLYDNGERKRAVSQSEIIRKQSLLGYQQAILTALLEIEQALEDQSRNLRQTAIQELEQKAQERVTRITQARYDSGAASAFDLIREQSNALFSQQTRLTNWRQGIRTSVSILNALGISPLKEQNQ